jgi:predicted DNA-binding protein with PD1-like motif
MQLRQIGSQPDFLLIVERGEDLPRILVDTCLQHGVSSALVDGSGRAQWLSLEGGPAGRRKIAGPLEVLQLSGLVEQRGAKQLAAELRVVASRDMDTGVEIVGGLLAEGVFDSAAIRIFKHQPVGVATVRPEHQAPARPPAKPEPPAPTWSAVAEVSAALPPPPAAQPEAPEDEQPRVGDLVEHPKFGSCVVRGLDHEHVKIRLEGGRTIELNLSHISFVLKGELSTGKRVYSVLVRRDR